MGYKTVGIIFNESKAKANEYAEAITKWLLKKNKKASK
jgi:hypothetical protein